MSALVLLAIAVAGSCFVRSYPRARYQQARCVGWDAYFHVASWGTLLFVAAFTVTLLLDWLNVPSKVLGLFGFSMHDVLPVYEMSALSLKTGFAGLLSMVLGPALGRLFNNRANQQAMTGYLASEYDLERMLYVSSTQGSLVQISLKSRKVYIGLVFDGSIADNAGQHEQFLIFPVLSGYRDTGTLEMVLTNSYQSFYETLDTDGWERFAGQFQTLIWVSEISSMAYFDPDAYAGIQSNITRVAPAKNTSAQSANSVTST